jgi:hypothetical protein
VQPVPGPPCSAVATALESIDFKTWTGLRHAFVSLLTVSCSRQPVALHTRRWAQSRQSFYGEAGRKLKQLSPHKFSAAPVFVSETDRNNGVTGHKKIFAKKSGIMIKEHLFLGVMQSYVCQVGQPSCHMCFRYTTASREFTTSSAMVGSYPASAHKCCGGFSLVLVNLQHLISLGLHTTCLCMRLQEPLLSKLLGVHLSTARPAAAYSVYGRPCIGRCSGLGCDRQQWHRE